MTQRIRTIVITVSDTRNEKNDLSGEAIIECLNEINALIIERIIVTDDLDSLVKTLIHKSKSANLIITTGGTGFASRDNTPEATKAVIEKETPGLAELMRYETGKISQKAYLSRGVCGIRGNCLIINFPGSPKAVKECFDVIKPLLKHAINLIEGETKH